MRKTTEGSPMSGATSADGAGRMPPERYDVVISGYGLTGIAVASLLSRQGHRVCVLERWPTMYGLPRMATIDSEGCRVVQAATGDVDRALRNTVPNPRYALANADSEILMESDWRGVAVSGFPVRSSMYQPDIEEAMDAQARANGVDVYQGWEVVGLEQNEDGVVVVGRERIVGEDGEVTWGRTREIAASYVIGADGARSAVREALAIERESWPFRGAWLTIDMVRKRELPDLFGISPDGRAAVVFCLPEGRSHSVIPLGTEHLRINFQVDPDADHRGEDRAAAYRRLDDVYALTEDDVDVYRVTCYAFEGKLAQKWRVGRALVAGDAAHLMTPFLGEGGCSALRDAANLSWKLDLVLRGLAPETLLDSYEVERKPHVRVNIDGSDRLAALAFELDAEAAAARDRAFLSRSVAPPVIHPKLTDGILQRADGGAVVAIVGELGPQGVVRRAGREGRFDDIFGWGFELIAWGDDPARHLPADDLELLDRLGTAVAGLAPEEGDGLWADVSGGYESFFGEHGVRAVLLRPDFIVFGVARSFQELHELVGDLAGQLGISREAPSLALQQRCS